MWNETSDFSGSSTLILCSIINGPLSPVIDSFPADSMNTSLLGPQTNISCSVVFYRLSSVQVSGKRTALLSNEARRELAKQARAVKEERRAALDSRHKYLTGRLVDGGTLVEPEVEDALVSDDEVTPRSDPESANSER